MRKKQDLTDEQKKFIEAHYTEMTQKEMADQLFLKSVYKVQRYMSAHNLEKLRPSLTEDQKQFIRDNFHQYKESELAMRFGLKSRMLIQQFKREEGLMRYRKNKAKRRAIVVTGCFNVDEMGWVI